MRVLGAKFQAVILVGASLFTSCAMAYGLNVAKWGKDADGCGLPSSPCLTIQHAINAALPHMTITVHPGSYSENLIIDRNKWGEPLRNFKLVSVAGYYSTIVEAADPTLPVIQVLQSDVQVGSQDSGFSFEGGSNCVELYRYGVSKVSIIANRAANCEQAGFRLSGTGHSISYNVADNNGLEGFDCAGCDDATVYSNSSTNNWLGFSFEYGGDLYIAKNYASENENAGFDFSSSVGAFTFANNVAERNNGDGVFVGNVKKALLQNNIAARNKRDGFWLGQADISFNEAGHVSKNLSVKNGLNGFHINAYDLKFTGNTAAQADGIGIVVKPHENIYGVDFLKFNSNATYASQGAGSLSTHEGIGILNRGIRLRYWNHFFGSPLGADDEADSDNRDAVLDKTHKNALTTGNASAKPPRVEVQAAAK